MFGDYIHKYYYNASIADGYTLRLIREEIETNYKMHLEQVLNNIKILKDNKIISGEKGSFILNPQIHWKGDTETRRRLLQNQEIKITFSIE